MADKSVIIPCNCAGCCTVLKIDVWDDITDHHNNREVWAELYRSYETHRLVDKIKLAWQIWRGGYPAVGCISMDEKEITQLRDFLNSL